MFAQGLQNIAASNNNNITSKQLPMSEVVKQYPNFFDISISSLVMHFTNSIDEYLQGVSSISKPNGLHILIDATLPPDLSENDSLPFYELFQRMVSFKCVPMTLLKLKDSIEKEGFKIMSSPFEIEKLPLERVGGMLNNMPFDQKIIVEDISKRHEISPSKLFMYKMINVFIIQKI